MEVEGSQGAATNICINDVVSFRDAEKVMYCRLCATVNNDAVSIFGEEGVRLKLADKINVALPIWVSCNMGPPLHVCRKCIADLETTVNFINQVVAAQKKINAVFKVLQDISKRNVPASWKRDASMPAFITYFRAKNFKKLDTMRRMHDHETEKENEGGNPKTTASNTQKMVDDSVSSLATEKSISTENEASTSDPPCVDLISDDSLGEDDVRDDFDEPVEDGAETHLANDETNLEVACQEDCTSSDPKVDIQSSGEVYQNVCKYCQKSFRWNTELLFHHTSAHQDVVFCCRVCFKVFYDDKEKFKNHVKSHSESKEADAAQARRESTPLDTDVNNIPSVESSYNTLSQNKSQGQVRMIYICKYCSRKYTKLHDLFSHQTEDHSDLVFRCTYCSKVFYENEEELLKHEESHGVHRNKFKSSEGSGADITQTIKDSSFSARVVYSTLTEKQQDWVNRILADKPRKKGVGNNFNANNSPSANVGDNDSPSVNVDAKISTSVNFNAEISPSVNVNANKSSSVNVSRSITLDNQVKMDYPVKVTSPANTAVYSVRVLDCQNLTQKPRETQPRVKTYICRACQVEFNTEEERELHRLFHHRLKLPCRYCPRTLAHKSKLLEHEATHFKKPKLTCKKCGEEFNNVEILKKHKRTHCIAHTLPRFSCQICKRLYIRESELKIHLETHLDERPFLCEKCGQCFKDVASLREHRSTPCKSKGFTRGYECELCDKKFHNARLLASHRIQQHRAMFPCPLCGLVFRSRPTMNNHMKIHSKILCLVCGEAFENLDHLQNHRKQKHPEEGMAEFSAFDVNCKAVSRLMCEVCEKCFANKLTLNVHKATHSSESAWQCHLCDEKFNSKFQLENHMSSHPGERPHKCNICDRTFTHYERLRQHEKVHFRDKGHLCEKCGKSFSTTLELSKHLVVHPTYNAFPCSFCSMSFSRKISLLIHQRTHTSKVYSCSICSENFSQLRLVEQHERTHHRNKNCTPMTSAEVDEDSLAASLLNMSEVIIGDGGANQVLEEAISTANVSSGDHVGGNEEGNSNIIIDSEYSEVVYVSNALDVIL